MRIAYLTRSYYPMTTGGALVRKAQVELFEKSDIDVLVITLGENSDNNIIRIKNDYNDFLCSLAERFGIYEDYLDPCISYNYKRIENECRNCDLVFATSGGELGMIRLGAMLHDRLKIPFVINLHDPIDFTSVLGKRINKSFHINRDDTEKQYLNSADLIITSSQVNMNSLIKKYPSLTNKIKVCYFGYLQNHRPALSRNIDSKVNIVYGGAFSHVQAPECLADALIDIPEVEITYIGNWLNYKPIKKITNKKVKLIPPMPYDRYLDYLCQKADITFISLKGDYFGACVPSKLFELINLAIPILGALPEGDASNIINSFGYGVAVKMEKKLIIQAYYSLKNRERLIQIREAMIRDKKKWSFVANGEKMVDWIKEVVNNKLTINV